jgi:hypothetical protein
VGVDPVPGEVGQPHRRHPGAGGGVEGERRDIGQHQPHPAVPQEAGLGLDPGLPARLQGAAALQGRLLVDVQRVALRQADVAGLRPELQRRRHVAADQRLRHGSNERDGEVRLEGPHPPQHLAEPDQVAEAVPGDVGREHPLAPVHLCVGQAKKSGQTRIPTAMTPASATAAQPCQVRSFLRWSTRPVA